MFTASLLEHGAHFVIRSDGEVAMVRLAGLCFMGRTGAASPSLCWRGDGIVRENPIGDILSDVDGLRHSGSGVAGCLLY